MSARLEVLVDGSWRPLRVVGATVVLTVTAVIVLGLALCWRCGWRRPSARCSRDRRPAERLEDSRENTR
jgi:hypothetical protein